MNPKLAPPNGSEGAAPPAAAEEFSGDSALALVRSGDRDPSEVAFEVAVVSFFVDATIELGIPRSLGALYGICFATPHPLSFADFHERLNISQGSISQGLRILREVGALRVVDEKGVLSEDARRKLDAYHAGNVSPRKHGRDYYTPNLELRKLTVHFIEARLEKQLKAGRLKLQAIKGIIPGSNAADIKQLKERLKYLQSWHDKGRALVPVVKTFLALS